MLTVVLVIHLMIAMGMIGLILLQKTEGNAAGGGFSASSMTAMMQPRARPNPLSRATTILGITFFVSSIGLALLTRTVAPTTSLLATPGAVSGHAPKVDDIQTPAGAAAPAAPDAAATPDAAAPPAVPTVPKN